MYRLKNSTRYFCNFHIRTINNLVHSHKKCSIDSGREQQNKRGSAHHLQQYRIRCCPAPARVIRRSIYSFMCFTRAFATTAVLLRAVSINDQRFNKIDSPATNLKSMSVYPAMFHKFINVTNTSVSTIQTVVLTADVSYYKNVSDVPRSFQS